jgi:predicted RNA polymerase sigma factor
MDRVEGLVQANWVEVRVLFGALRKAPQTAGIVSLVAACSVAVEHGRENGFENAEHRMCSPAARGFDG